MAFGDKTDETVVDHDVEAAEQAAIAAEVEEAPAEEAPVAEQPPTVQETAETDPLAAPPEPTVTVEATNTDLSSAAVAGYEVDFADGVQVEDVPAFVAEELALGENVEVVA
jgi:hypothetical protein